MSERSYPFNFYYRSCNSYLVNDNDEGIRQPDHFGCLMIFSPGVGFGREYSAIWKNHAITSDFKMERIDWEDWKTRHFNHAVNQSDEISRQRYDALLKEYIIFLPEEDEAPPLRLVDTPAEYKV